METLFEHILTKITASVNANEVFGGEKNINALRTYCDGIPASTLVDMLTNPATPFVSELQGIDRKIADAGVNVTVRHLYAGLDHAFRYTVYFGDFFRAEIESAQGMCFPLEIRFYMTHNPRSHIPALTITGVESAQAIQDAFAPLEKARLDPLETGLYIGNGEDGVYVDWCYAAGIVFTLSVVDSDTGAYSDAYDTDWLIVGHNAGRAIDFVKAKLFHARQWCIDNGVFLDEGELDERAGEVDARFRLEMNSA